jgi:hypothetical protein
MKVSIDTSKQNNIDNSIKNSYLAPFGTDLTKLLNIYSNLKMVEFTIISADNKGGLSFGEFSVVCYSLQVTANNINALSKKFTGYKKTGLTQAQLHGQNYLLALSQFNELMEIFYPKDHYKSWFNLDRLNAAHEKDLFKLFLTSKKGLNLQYLEQSKIFTIIKCIEIVFEKLLNINDIMLFNLEGKIDPFEIVTDKATDLAKISTNEFGDFILAHTQSLTIEKLATAAAQRNSIEYFSSHKLLVQSVTEAFQNFTQNYTGSEWHIIQNMTGLLQLKTLRNNIAHSEDMTDLSLRSVTMENYSKLYNYVGNNELYKILREASKQFEYIYNFHNTKSETNEPVVDSNEVSNEKTTHMKINKRFSKASEKLIKKDSKDDFDILLKNIKDEDVKNGIRHEREEYLEGIRNLLIYTEAVSCFLEAQKKLLKTSLEKNIELGKIEGPRFVELPVEIYKSLSLLEDIFKNDPSLIFFCNNSAGLNAFFRLMSFKTSKLEFFKTSISNGLNLIQLNKKIGNLLLTLMEGEATGKYSFETLQTYELILKNYSKDRLDELLNTSQKLDELGVRAKFEMVASNNENIEVTAIPIKASVVSLAIYNGNIELYKLFNQYGGNPNKDFDIRVFARNNFTKQIFDRLTINPLSNAIDCGEYTLALEIIKSANFQSELNIFLKAPSSCYAHKIQGIKYGIFDRITLSLLAECNLDRSEAICLLEIGETLIKKGAKIINLPKFLPVLYIPTYKIIVEQKADWLIDIALKHYPKSLIDVAQNQKHFFILEDLVNRGQKEIILKFLKQEKISEDDYIKAKEYTLTQKLIYDNLSPSTKSKLLNKIVSTADIEALNNVLSEGIINQIKETREYKTLPPLNIAIMKKSPEMVKLLLAHGEKPTEVQLDLAKKMGGSEIIAELEHSLIASHIEEPSNAQENTDLSQQEIPSNIELDPLGDTQDLV